LHSSSNLYAKPTQAWKRLRMETGYGSLPAHGHSRVTLERSAGETGAETLCTRRRNHYLPGGITFPRGE